MNLRSALVLLALGLLSSACAARTSILGGQPVGCYLFDTPVSYSASGSREAGDSAWYLLSLEREGRVERPLLRGAARSLYAERSSWRVTGDTLRILVHDGLVGWDLVLMPDDGGYRGMGTYLSDAIAVGRAPITRVFSARRTACNS